MCFQCETPHLRRRSVPTGSIIRDVTTGIVDVVKEKCVGCLRPALSPAPSEGIVFSSDERVAVKMQWCAKANRICVAVCPTQAWIQKRI